tara:strand:- start:301 stop:750 length:450 start_codon:yes stop_codon:yes gene_type:complete
MIITCPCGEKKFEIDAALIPNEGRTLKCGSCDHVWFYKKEEQIDDYEIEEKTLEIVDKSTTTKSPIKSNEKSKKESNDKALVKYQKKEVLNLGKVFRYILVIILSLITLIVLLDTLKVPLSNIFPNLEFILFNLYETIRDITLFLKDLI